jgi:uncharacterized protein with HEPN domain
MSQKDDTLYLGHMLEVARWIQQRLATTSRQEFDANMELRLAVVHQLQIIGEAAGRVSEATKQRSPGIPWHLITSMRHRIVHDYVNIDFEIVWTTATRDIVTLVGELAKLVPPAD